MGFASNSSAIAVVGMACRFPNAPSPHAFWRLLRDGASWLAFDVVIGRTSHWQRLAPDSSAPSGSMGWLPGKASFTSGAIAMRCSLHQPPTARLNSRADHQIGVEDLGGWRAHAATEVARLVAVDDHSAVELFRRLPRRLALALGGCPLRPRTVGLPAGRAVDHLPSSMRYAYDVRALITPLGEGGRYVDLAARWAGNMATRLARPDGRRVGVIATRPRNLDGTIVRTALRRPHGSHICATAPCHCARWSQ
jgi:hypothetical protein